MTTEIMKAQPAMDVNSLDDAERALDRIQIIDSNIKARESEVNTELAELRTSRLTGIDKLEEEKLGIETNLEKFVDSKRSSLFPDDKKTIEIRSGFLKYRKNPPSVVIKKSKTIKTFADVIAAIKKKGWRGLIAQSDPTLDKKSVLAQHQAKKLTNADLATVGLEVKEDEVFTYDLKEATTK